MTTQRDPASYQGTTSVVPNRHQPFFGFSRCVGDEEELYTPAFTGGKYPR
jgi:hypothetical protein